jgi:hypothetical protein
MDVDVATDAEIAQAVAEIDAWIAEWLHEGSFLVAADKQVVTDGTATHRWYLRFAGEEKDAITVWATLSQRTLQTEVQLMPEPEGNVEDVLRYLFSQNAELYGMAYAFGPENAIYLMGRISASLVSEEVLDRIFGSSVHYVDQHFPQAMTLGFPGRYRRRSKG